MSLLKQPSELSAAPLLKGMLYGQPGVGKSTLALSAPNPVVIDADRGMYRVEKRYQVPSLPLTDYKKVIELFQGNELDGFQTIVFDTAGKLIDRIADYVMETNPKNRQGDGSLSMKGWGAIKTEFQKLLRMAESKQKHVIFVAHEREDKDGDTRIIRPDISGSSGKDLIKDLDFIGYIEMRGSRHTISFTPCEKFYAKNSLSLPAIIEIPTTAKGNTFIQDVIIAQTKKRMQDEDQLVAQYEGIRAEFADEIENIENAKDANLVLKEINDADHVWDSLLVAKHQLNEKTKELGLTFDRKKAAFIDPPKAKVQEADAVATIEKKEGAEDASDNALAA